VRRSRFRLIAVVSAADADAYETTAADDDRASAGAIGSHPAPASVQEQRRPADCSYPCAGAAPTVPTTATTIENADRLADFLVGVSHAFTGSWSQ
jgi:hypothetical protein